MNKRVEYGKKEKKEGRRKSRKEDGRRFFFCETSLKVELDVGKSAIFHSQTVKPPFCCEFHIGHTKLGLGSSNTVFASLPLITVI